VASTNIVGEVHGANLLLAGPTVSHGVGRVAGVECGVEPGPAVGVDAVGAEEHQLADVVKRVALPPSVLEPGLLHPLPALRDSLVREATPWNGSITTVTSASGLGRGVTGCGLITAVR
jgi:hypothetical protein